MRFSPRMLLDQLQFPPAVKKVQTSLGNSASEVLGLTNCFPNIMSSFSYLFWLKISPWALAKDFWMISRLILYEPFKSIFLLSHTCVELPLSSSSAANFYNKLLFWDLRFLIPNAPFLVLHNRIPFYLMRLFLVTVSFPEEVSSDRV